MQTVTGIKSHAIASMKWSGVSMVLVSAIQFVTTVILARLLGPQDFGLMGMLTVIIGLAQVLSDGGTGGAIISRQAATIDQLSSLYWFNLCVGLLLFTIILLGRTFAVIFFREERLFVLLSLVAFIPLIASTGQQFQFLLQKELRFKEISSVEILGIIVWATCTIGLATLGWGVMSLVIGQIVRVGVMAGLWLILGWSQWRPRIHFHRQDLNGFVSFGLFQMAEVIVQQLRFNIDYLLIGRFLGTELLGFYTLAYQLVLTPFQKISPAISRVFFPAFARFQADDERLRRWYLKSIQMLAFIAMPLYIGLALISNVLIPAVFGTQWSPSIPVAQILCFLAIFYMISFPIGSLLLAKGRAGLSFKYAILACALQFVANAIGLQAGIAGIAASTLVLTILLFSTAGFILRWWVVKMRVKEFLVCLRFPLISSSVMALVLVLLRTIWPDIPLVVSVLSAAAAYGITFKIINQAFLGEMLALIRQRRLEEI